MEEYFVTYEQALALKELGFDEPCFKYIYTGDTGNNVSRYEEVEPSRAKNYNKYFLCISQPLKQQVFKWFWVYFHLSHNIFDWLDDFEITITEWSLCEDRIVYEYPRFDTYEQAESACIDKLISVIKEKKS
jgi:hypothetical protein